ncbi:MAG: 3-hydroxyacyl-CoA dehydrogenase NAD-binding domain-containing protein [Myxococcota bacterium]|jgi:3-hydroxyacyl-CoA dehydrogenase|nr:3-hydroxyacyl-CoA dehydrogenase NAD-binding domain-containing protein [Myxococcota bacterium]
MKRIEKAGVIGAGVMGATIAAHLANAGIETILLDIVPRELDDKEKKKGVDPASRAFRDKLAAVGLDRAVKMKPAAFYLAKNAELITVGNLEDDLAKLADVDWIIEVVVERLDIKRALFERIETVMKDGQLISSNTSGLPATQLCEGRSEAFRKGFVITHFFNPPRYLRLLEIVPGPDTTPEAVKILSETCERALGKGIVYAKDTPNFVANRIGAFSLLYGVRSMLEYGLNIEEVDALTGPVIGRPKSASFRTADLVGLDTLMHVASNVYDGAPSDEQRDVFVKNEFIKGMLDKNFLGDKTGAGFYKKGKAEDGKKIILSVDPKTLAHVPQKKVSFASLEAAKAAAGSSEKLRTLFYADDKAGQFSFDHIGTTLVYAANRVPEIADDIVDVDNAMRWGFGWKQGPFEVWDTLGLKKSCDKLKAAGHKLPAWIESMLAAGHTSFYRLQDGTPERYVPTKNAYEAIAEKPGVIRLPVLKARGKTLLENAGASLVDIGDGVACFEFHSKMNSIGDDILTLMNKACDLVERDYEAMIVANHSDNFSVGANLGMILFTAQEEEWDDLEFMVRAFQSSLMRLKLLRKPVVAAPSGMALGGGCEVCMASARVRYHAETYMGLVEAGVGVIPGGGGTKELVLRATENLFEVKRGGIYQGQLELKPWIARAFEAIAMAKVSMSGPEAMELGFLRPTDKVTLNRDFLIEDAKKTALALVMEGYTPPRKRTDVRVGGEPLLASLELALWTMFESHFITPHDVTVSKKLAYVMCGGRVHGDTVVTEDYLLDLEREAFLSLCGTKETQARMQHMLVHGKPLRN